MKNLMISVLLCLSIPACKVTAWEDKTDFVPGGIGSHDITPTRTDRIKVGDAPWGNDGA